MIETARLILRGWGDADGETFARVTNSPAVMMHLGGVAPAERLARLAAEQQALQARDGHCFWIVERKADRALLGFCGLEKGDVGPIAGEIEIGWRLREDAWGQGYAKEAAFASLAWGWAHLDAPRIMAITTPANRASWGLMERLGMTRRHDLDFGHPAFARDHPLSAHITYVADRPVH
ncbi:GNAT family N-acetyltransferase [Sphingomonas abietis]|uniref:GNAT family N-acetyltransferase n=1 Tax=Sphingomonas abietis TaxID=3012344 RepID=A0ABY7NS64_9SPHN|nr:GNAT family N-acetyltransferase [Sphingomonas abietis]WBO24213.1 GNAT family N-acetyltransferase [Sphingomonas abietis]